MKLTMLLCDHVAVAEGKLFINGAGWNLTGPDPTPSGLAVLIEVPWDQTNRTIALRLRLLHEDGEPVSQLMPDGVLPVEVGADVEVGRPPGVAAGSSLPVPLAINLPPLALPPGQGYVWQGEVNGQTRPDWRLSFRTRPEDVSAGPGGHGGAGGPGGSSDPTAIPGF